jgi:hypothetical protein
MYGEDYTKLIDVKKVNIGNISLKDIQNNAKDMVNNFIKKYEKMNV